MKFTFDFERFQKLKNKMCPCRIGPGENETVDDIICPCTEFCTTGKCICNLFIQVKDEE